MVVKSIEPRAAKAATKPRPKAKPPAGDHITHHAAGLATQMRALTSPEAGTLKRALNDWGIDLRPGVNVITVRLTMPGGAPKKAAKRQGGN